MPEGKSRTPPPSPPLQPPPAAAAHPAPPPLPPAAFVESSGHCANCLATLAGPFCAQCGQHVADYHRSVWRFVTDFFENAFSWDNKFLRTLVPLLRRPGWLTQEFMAGRRVRYVHPLRLFLFTSAICLALLQYTHHSGMKMRVGKTRDAKHIASVQLGDGDEGAAEAHASPLPSPAVNVSPAASPTAKDDLGAIVRDTVKSAGAGRTRDAALDRRWEALGDRLQQKIDAAGGMEKFNERVTTNVQSKLSWVALAMLPIFALFMRMFFGRAGGYYFTYLVFSLHYHTFLLMFWVAYSWVSGLGSYLHSDLLQLVTAVGLLVPPWYLFRALRQMYGQEWGVTAGKVFAIGAVHLLTLVAGLAMIGATAFL